MLPPPVPGLVGGPMMGAGGHMMPGMHPATARMPWQPPMDGSMPGLCPMPTGSVSTCMGQPSMPMFNSCPSESPGTDVLAPPVPKATTSGATFSHDFTTETAMAGMQWDDVGMLDFDDGAAGADAVGLHKFNEELLSEDDAAAVDGTADAADAAAAPDIAAGDAEPAKAAAAAIAAGGGADDATGDAFTWMDEELLLDDALDNSAVCLDMMG